MKAISSSSSRLTRTDVCKQQRQSGRLVRHSGSGFQQACPDHLCTSVSHGPSQRLSVSRPKMRIKHLPFRKGDVKTKKANKCKRCSRHSSPLESITTIFTTNPRPQTRFAREAEPPPETNAATPNPASAAGFPERPRRARALATCSAACAGSGP